MPTISHQTIKLSRGKHRSPEDGACVMELASMLAGERFTDHPVSVCPVIGSFLRAYNDLIDDFRRQDLYGYASKIVGSRSSKDIQRQRAERLVEWSRDMTGRGPGRLVRLRRVSRMGKAQTERIGIIAVRSIRHSTNTTHSAALGLIDELLSTGTRDEVKPADAGFTYASLGPADEVRGHEEWTR
jgi:hypothetical protein